MLGSLPFLTLPDPPVKGEGSLDPLGLASVAEHLADQILPGLRARMSRPRFVAAIAVSAAVCDGLEERYAADGITSAHLVFEWLFVEAFARESESETTLRIPGIQKARDVLRRGESMCARNYLKAPSVFGFHGVYKPLARHLGVVDDELRLADRGYELLKIWQSEQKLEGFLESAFANGPGRSARQTLRDAVEDGLEAGRTKRSSGWQGWGILANHLAPGGIGRREARFFARLLEDQEAEPRGEVFRLLAGARRAAQLTEDEIARTFLLPKASASLRASLQAVVAYERACAIVEEAFDWIRYLSTKAIGRPVTAATFAREPRIERLAKNLPSALADAQEALACAPVPAQQQLSTIGSAFDGVASAERLFEAVLARHEDVQKNKPPEGKRPWFERSPDGAAYVRPLYRLHDRPGTRRAWNRPYRMQTVVSFLQDLKAARRA